MNATGDALLSCVWATARTPAPSEWSMCTYPGPLDKYVSRAVQATGCWLECDDVTWMQRLLRSTTSPLLIDVGGNIGFYTLAAAAAGSAVAVFEPHPVNALHLLSSVRRNSFRSVQLHTLCVSDAVAPCTLGEHKTNQGALKHSTAEAISALAPEAAKYRTMAVPLDAVLPPPRRPTFLKVDIEGDECKAFRGMTRLLNASAGTFVGALIEFDKIKCCEELVAPSGAFWVLQQRHGLCAYVARVARPAQTTPTPLASLCSIRRNGRQINLRWQRCDG